jgi:hypothetical protein
MICEICKNDYKNFLNHLKSHNINGIEYYCKYILKLNEIPKCKCGKEITKFKGRKIENGLSEYCSHECYISDNKKRHKEGIFINHSEKMKQLHKEGKYKETSHFINYNKTKKHSDIVSKFAKNRRLEKESKGFNSEYSDRIRNLNNILERFSNNDKRYLYILEYDNKIKLGSTSNINRRFKELNGYNKCYLYEGNVEIIASLECALFIKYKNYTLLDDSKSFYTEYLEKSILNSLLEKLNDQEKISSTTRC